jgi:hypothetical protein
MEDNSYDIQVKKPNDFTIVYPAIIWFWVLLSLSYKATASGQKTGFIRGMASLGGDNLVVCYYLSALKSGLIRVVAFDESDLLRGQLLYILSL